MLAENHKEKSIDENTLYGISCNHDLGRVNFMPNSEEARCLKRLLENKIKQRDELTGKEKLRLQELEKKKSDGVLSHEDQKEYDIWWNLNVAINEMKVLFLSEYNREVLNFDNITKESCYRFLTILEQFDALCAEEK